MNLLMYVGDDLVESVPLEKEMISKPGYLGNFKRRLQNKYREVFPNAPKPQFFGKPNNPNQSCGYVDQGYSASLTIF
jgi:hypothetical protein